MSWRRSRGPTIPEESRFDRLTAGDLFLTLEGDLANGDPPGRCVPGVHPRTGAGTGPAPDRPGRTHWRRPRPCAASSLSSAKELIPFAP